MTPLYVPATGTIIQNAHERYVHPITGEVYGGTDYDDPKKLAEIGALPLEFSEGEKPENPVESGFRVEMKDGKAVRVQLWRGITEEELAERDKRKAEEKLSATDADMARVVEDLKTRQDALIEALTKAGVLKAGDVPDIPDEAKAKIAERESLRQDYADATEKLVSLTK